MSGLAVAPHRSKSLGAAGEGKAGNPGRSSVLTPEPAAPCCKAPRCASVSGTPNYLGAAQPTSSVSSQPNLTSCRKPSIVSQPHLPHSSLRQLSDPGRAQACWRILTLIETSTVPLFLPCYEEIFECSPPTHSHPSVHADQAHRQYVQWALRRCAFGAAAVASDQALCVLSM